MKSNFQTLWDQTGVDARLRRPKQQPSSITRNQEAEVSIPAFENEKPEEKPLNPDAPEFVPKSFIPQNVHISVSDCPQLQRPSVQSRLHRFKPGGAAPEQMEARCPETHQNINMANGYYQEGDSNDTIRLKQLISSLIKYPGQFDDLLGVFMETLYPYYNDILAMTEIASLLVSEAIQSPNFRYNGARLCWYVEQKCPEFRAALHLRCQKEIQDNLDQQSVVLFVAELYTQLPHDGLYGSLLIDSLTKLITLGGNDNIKCVCQALKLTGYSLENNNKEALDDVFIRLRGFRNILSGSALILLNSVINLRELNWGRSLSESHHSDSSDYDADYEEMVKSMVYETEGAELTNEEQEFLVANATNDEYLIDNEDPDALCDPEPEMDEEIQAAFEEFVKYSKA